MNQQEGDNKKKAKKAEAFSDYKYLISDCRFQQSYVIF